VEGFAVELVDESNLFEWKIYIEGPKDTLYEGGVFQLTMKFPSDFPMSPPELRFMSDFWHPNVYRDTGLVCISILHPPVEDEMSGELASERWLPTQTVTTILLSVISLLNSPNFSSPANVDASVEWRNDPVGYKKKCARLVEKANKEKPSTVVIPHPDTNKEERERQIEKMKSLNKPDLELDDFMNEVPEDDTGSVEDGNGSEREDTEGSSESKEEKKSSKKSTSGKKKESNSKFSKNETDNIDEEKSDESRVKPSKQESKSSFRDSTQDSSTKKKSKGRKKKCLIM